MTQIGGGRPGQQRGYDKSATVRDSFLDPEWLKGEPTTRQVQWLSWVFATQEKKKERKILTVRESLKLFIKAHCYRAIMFAYLALLIGSWNLHGHWWCAFFWACCNSFGAKNLVYRLFRPNVVIFFIGQTGASLAPKNVWQVSVW